MIDFQRCSELRWFTMFCKMSELAVVDLLFIVLIMKYLFQS